MINEDRDNHGAHYNVPVLNEQGCFLKLNDFV